MREQIVDNIAILSLCSQSCVQQWQIKKLKRYVCEKNPSIQSSGRINYDLRVRWSCVTEK